MNLLDRHIFKSVLFTCVAAVALFSFVVALPNVVKDLLGPLLADQITPDTFFRLLLLIFPYAISYALPMGILTGVLLTLGRLSADNEITAMRTAGVSLTRVARPVFIIGALGAAVALYNNFESMPWARVQYHREFAEALRKQPQSFLVPKTFIRDFKGIVIYVGDKSADETLRDIWVWELDEQKRVTRFIRAEAGRIDFDAKTSSLVPRLFNARTEERNADDPEDFSKSPYAPAVGLAGDDLLRLSLANYLGQSANRMKSDWLTYGQLHERLAELADAPPPKTAQETAERTAKRMEFSLVLNDKFNLSLAVFSFALLGVPLGIKVSRRETSANLGLALVLVMSYYFFTVVVKWLDQMPEYRPDLLLWAPNLLFIALGLMLFRRIGRT